MKQLTSKELQILTSKWQEWCDSAPNDSQRRSRERLLLVFLLIRYGALRLGEALDLNDLKDFDFSTCTIKIMGLRAREVQIPDNAMQAIRMIVESPRMLRLRGIITHMDQGYVRKRFYAFASELGVEASLVGPQAVRQARGTELLRGNIPLNIVQKFMGQRSPVQTASFISFTDDDAKRIVHHHLRQEALKRSSARNAFTGNVSRLNTGTVSVNVEITTLQGQKVSALITIESSQRLGIHLGQILNATVKAPYVILEANPSKDWTGNNRFCGEVIHINRGDVESSVVIDIQDGSSMCSIVSTDELDELGLREGHQAGVYFSPFSVVLTLPEE